MSRIRGTDTTPEIKVRKALHAMGFRYRKNVRSLPGTPDIVLPKYRSVIFVNGCFWHGHKDCRYYTIPKTNTDFWQAKVNRNKERDQEVFRALEALQWRVIIVWECSLKRGHMEQTMEQIAQQIRQNGITWEKQRSDRRRIREEYRQLRKDQAEEHNRIIETL